MDDGLIATCREASSDLSLDDENEIPEACVWSFTQFIEQFKWLHDLLHNLQVAKEGDDMKSNAKTLEEQQKIAYLCKLFNEQAQKLSKKYPDMRDEVNRYLNLLNNKWKAVDQSINSSKVKSPSKDCVFDEIANRMRNLRRWLRELESSLCPVNLASEWTLDNLEQKYKEQEVLQKEIEAKGKHVSSLLKLCEHLKGKVRFGNNSLMTWDAERVRKVANNLEHRWHTILLKSLECQYILEELIQNRKTDFGKLEKSFNEEPVKKYPRLSSDCEEIALIENEIKSKMSSKCNDIPDDRSQDNEFFQLIDTASQVEDITLRNDKAVMVGDTGIAELKAECKNGCGKFEIVQDVGYSSETSAHLSNDEKQDITDSPNNGVIIENKLVHSEDVPIKVPSNKYFGTSTNYSGIYLAPDKYPSISLKTLNILSDEKQFYNPKYTSCKSVPDTFYKVTSVEEYIFEDAVELQESIDKKQLDKTTLDSPVGIQSSNVNKSHNIDEVLVPDAQQEVKLINSLENAVKETTVCIPSSTEKDSSCSRYNSLHLENPLSSNSVQKKNKKGPKMMNNIFLKGHQPNEHIKKTARVREWLNTCQSADDGTSDDNTESHEKPIISDYKAVDSSCDASGEYTTTESDSEKSNVSDVNNSASFSQSFTGSIETVIPVVPEENSTTQNVSGVSMEQSSGVRLRKKKRTGRDRPWSVTDVHQTTFPTPLVPHSTSESALDLLFSVQENRKNVKRLSLTDISTYSCPSIKSHKAYENNSRIPSHRSNSGSEKTKRKNSNRNVDNSDFMSSALPEIVRGVTTDSSAGIASDCYANKENSETVCESVLEKLSTLEASLSTENNKNESACNIEDQGSISDQAWDEYQDPPYLSEPYSEQTADEDVVKKLINFGDDYRAILGSYSDASSVSLKASKSHRSRSRSFHKTNSQGSRDSYFTDSNSDSEDFHNILKTSRHALQFVKNTLKENSGRLSSLSSEFAELVATSQTNLCHLYAVHDELAVGCELESLSKEDLLKLQELIKEWEEVQINLLSLSKSEGEQKASNADLEAAILDVQCSLEALKKSLSTVATNAEDAVEKTLSFEQLRTKVHNLQSGLSQLQELKEGVLSVSARILRLISEGGGPTITSLRDSATKLYQQWEDVYELNCSQLTKLQTLQSHWHHSTEKEAEEEMEISIQWQPVQVGSNLPKGEAITEEFYENTAAEVQLADEHNVLMEIKTDSRIEEVQCCILEDANKELQQPVLHSCPPVLKISRSKEKSPSTESENRALYSRRRSCFWRTVRAAVPIQFALVVLYCMSCLLEPRCCENMNNYERIFMPHLRYFGGPPPV